MKNLNKHTEDYLDHYCKIENPEFAVLLKGKWGSGKTWFIKEYIKKLEKKGKKKIYVSLYGISSTAEIEDLFYQELHPLLSSKGMAVAGKIAKGLLRTTLKIDLDGNKGSTETALNSQVPDIYLPDYLKDTQDRILIFDDLERCLMNIEAVLGYVNYFVEHQGLRVIVIANEEEIISQKNVKSNEAYRTIKEKLIGKTFKIEQDFDSVLSKTIKRHTGRFKDVLKESREEIKRIYVSSGYENLRHLKQTVSDFKRFFELLPMRFKEEATLVTELFKIFLVFSFEIKHGNIIPSEIKKVREESIYKFVHDGKRESTIFDEIVSKYLSVNFYDLILTDEQWAEFFDKSFLQEKDIEQSLYNSEYYRNSNAPYWVRLWHYWNLDDKKFDTVLTKVVNDFKSRRFSELGIILHVFGLLLYLSEVGLYKEKTKNVEIEFRSYVDYLKSKTLLVDKEQYSFSFHNDYNGLQIFSSDKEEFKKGLQYLNTKISESKNENLPKEGANLVDLMVSNVSKFSSAICLSGSESASYSQIPIFCYIQPEEFISKYFQVESSERRRVAAAISERYKYNDINEKLIDELSWLKRLIKAAKKEVKERSGKLSGHVLSLNLVSAIERAISRLEEKQKELLAKKINDKVSPERKN